MAGTYKSSILERKMIWSKLPWGHVPAVNIQTSHGGLNIWKDSLMWMAAFGQAAWPVQFLEPWEVFFGDFLFADFFLKGVKYLYSNNMNIDDNKPIFKM